MINRLEALDGLRGIAIIMVIAYHYLSRFPLYYPYGASFSGVASEGYLGVHLFFIISGFVIALSISRTPKVFEFAIGRLVRLWPAMIICSIFTFSILNLGQTDFALERRADFTGFVPSLTFSHPEIWRPILGEAKWIDGVYWSLFVEVRFYFWIAIASAILGPNRIFIAMFAMVIGSFLLDSLFNIYSLDGTGRTIIDLLFFVEYLPLFCIGMCCYNIHQGRQAHFSILAFYVAVILSVLQSKGAFDAGFIVFSSHIVLAFSLKIFPRLTNLLGSKFLIFIGSISYSLYLLHQNIGVYMITLIPGGLPSAIYLVIILAITSIIIGISWIVFRYIERPTQLAWKNLRANIRRKQLTERRSR